MCIAGIEVCGIGSISHYQPPATKKISKLRVTFSMLIDFGIDAQDQKTTRRNSPRKGLVRSREESI